MADRQKNVMVVSSSQKAEEYLVDVLSEEKRCAVSVARSAEDAKKIMFKTRVDAVFIDTPLQDDFGLKLARELLAIRDVCIAFIVEPSCYEKVLDKVEEFGMMTISRPADRVLLRQAAGMLLAMSAKMRSLEKRASSYEPKMQEAHIINRAKRLLIDRLKMSEAQAHRYIEKTAMDSCVKKREIAENIIRIYDS